MAFLADDYDPSLFESAVDDKPGIQKDLIDQDMHPVEPVFDDTKTTKKQKKRCGRPSKNGTSVYVPGVWQETLTYMRSLFSDGDSLSYTDIINLGVYCLCEDDDLRKAMASKLNDKQLAVLPTFMGRNPFVNIQDSINVFVDMQKQAMRSLRRIENCSYDNLCLSSYDLMDRKGWTTRVEVANTSLFCATSGGSGNGDPDVIVDVCELARKSSTRLRSRLNEPEGRNIGKTVGNKTIFK